MAFWSSIDSNYIQTVTKWPDPTLGTASSSMRETTTVNALGQAVTYTDRNGSVHTLTYDVLGREVSDAVTTLGSGVDGAVRRVETAYDGPGNPYLITSYDAASGGNVVNQVQRVFNGLGQMTAEYQEHGGAVSTSTSPKVQYAYSEMPSGANHSRLTSITYSDGYVLTYNYSSGLNDGISRLSSLSDTTGTLESYSYLGLGTVVVRSHPQPGIDQTLVGTPGDAGDQYAGLDRFGRVTDQKWENTSTSTATDEFQYAYDLVGNRTYRDNLVNTSFGEMYSYDDLSQLVSFQRGTLNGTKDGITGTVARSQGWDLDATGNFDGVTTNGTTQTRTADRQNEITSISGATTPTYDSNGNMTGDEAGRQFVYDAWNRLVAVKNSSGTTLETFGYDGLNRRASETAGGTTTDLYYSSDWQVLAEKVGTSYTKRYVWSPAYVDAMVLRDRDTNGDGTLDERLWVQQDANWNVTALVDGSGNVVERYVYDPYGVRTVYDASYTLRSGGSAYDFAQGFQGMFFDSVSGTNKSRERTDYSPTLGRWVSVDPIRFAGGDVNLYGFVGNNPTGRLDPSGLADVDWSKKWEWHHMFPQEFKGQFPDFDFDAPENGRLVTGGAHRGEGNSIHSLKWNEDWEQWIKDEKTAGRPITPDSIQTQAKKMMKSEKYKAAFEGTREVTERYDVRKARLAKAAKECEEQGAKKLSSKVGKRLRKMIPGVSTILTVLFWTDDVEAKGPVGGTANSVLDATPGLSTVKGGIELFTGDLIANKGEKGPIARYLPMHPFHTPVIPSVLPGSPGHSTHSSYGTFPGAGPGQLPGDIRGTVYSPTLGQFRIRPWRP